MYFARGLAVLVVALATLAEGAPRRGAADSGDEFDCAVRQYAYEYAAAKQAWRGPTYTKEVWDSLELTTVCNQTYPGASRARSAPDALYINSNLPTLFVDPAGDDGGDGSIGRPFRTVHRAVQEFRELSTDPHRGNPFYGGAAAGLGSYSSAVRGGAAARNIVLRGGVHHLNATLKLTQQDSGTSIQGYPGEDAVMSGATPVHTDWQPVPGSDNVFYTDLASQGVSKVAALRVGEGRAFRASYPNRNPEIGLFPDGWVKGGKGEVWRAPRTPSTAPVFVKLDSPYVEDKTMFQYYTVGINDTCEIFTPPVSYWCAKEVQGGGVFRFRVPSGVTIPTDIAKLKAYANVSAGVFHTWRPGHWSVWMFQIDTYDAGTQAFTWSHGGFQGARGDDDGSDWYIENLLEELDSPNEFYFDEAQQRLFYCFNTSGGKPDPELQFAVVNLETLVSHVGASPTDPVRNIAIRGVTIRDSAPTYMAPHGVPSGGDWALERFGAVFYENTEFCTVNRSLLTRLDGNAIMISGYNRNTSMNDNEFSWLGATAVAAWGYTEPLGQDDAVLAQYRMGVSEGKLQEQPLGTVATGNYVHEIGHFQKQASFWFQSKAAETLLQNNVAFNMPRAGINFNDGFGGGSKVLDNLLYNTCRESGDHADFNSWDRQPYYTSLLNGTLSFAPRYNEIAYNFVIGDHNAVNTIDNDDGSSWYLIHDNFLVRGGHKTNFGGHNKYSYNNINANARVYQDGLCVRDNADNYEGHTDGYWNNTCTQDAVNLPVYTFTFCNPQDLKSSTGIVTMHDNRIYTPSANLTFLCNGTTMAYSAFQAAGFDTNTVLTKPPSTAEVISWAKALLR